MIGKLQRPIIKSVNCRRLFKNFLLRNRKLFKITHYLFEEIICFREANILSRKWTDWYRDTKRIYMFYSDRDFASVFVSVH